MLDAQGGNIDALVAELQTPDATVAGRRLRPVRFVA